MEENPEAIHPCKAKKRQINSSLWSEAKKRERNPLLWKREIEKRWRYCPTEDPTYPTCGHTSMAYQCALLDETDIKQFHRNFYSSSEKMKQDLFILQHVETMPCKRRRTDSKSEKKTMSVKYFVDSETKEQKIPVCRKAFLEVLCISKNRLYFITRNFMNDGSFLPSEKRGGDRKSTLFDSRKKSVMAFINNFKGLELKEDKTYLPSELNVKKMWQIYNASAEESNRVGEWYFRNIFNTKFNISFGLPGTDDCCKSEEKPKF